MIVEQSLIVLLLNRRVRNINHILPLLDAAHSIPYLRRRKRRFHGLISEGLPIVVFEPDVRLELLDSINTESGLGSTPDAEVDEMARLKIPVRRDVCLL